MNRRITAVLALSMALAAVVLVGFVSPANAARAVAAPVTPAPVAGSTWHGHKIAAVIPADTSKATNVTRGPTILNGVRIASAITSMDCPVVNASPVVNPLGFNDNKIFLRFSWHAQLTTSGRPEATLQLGNSTFVESNHTDGYTFYFDDGVWYDFKYDANRAGNFYGWHEANTQFTSPFLVANGGQVGVHINSNGTASSPWVMAPGGLSGNGLRQLIEYYGEDSPTYLIALFDKNNHNLSTVTKFIIEVGRDAFGNVTCGNALVDTSQT